MKIVNTGTVYRIYDESLQTYDSLPVGTYKVCFSKMMGFFLEKAPDVVINEKIYGVHETKVDKIMNSFKGFERNLGVILSGDKGIGKSVCAKMIALRALKENLPVIICSDYIPGIADYIGTLEQEVVILFDEFDKTFNCGSVTDCDDDATPRRVNDCQAEMLTLFDGMTPGKKLFVVTCNKLTNLNEFLVNRPGRFHYHLRFEYPTAEEIREYLQDKIDEKYWSEIDGVVSFASRVDINYDCLRAIAFELSNGLTFAEAIKDLNIVNCDTYDEYTATLVLTDGTKLTLKRVNINFYDEYEDDFTLRFTDHNNRKFYWVSFDPSDSRYDSDRLMTIIDGKNVSMSSEKYGLVEAPDEDENIIKAEVKKVAYIAFKRKVSKGIHYAI